MVRNLALADITGDDVAAMLSENETLFVEHKANIGAEAFQVAKAMCSFANTLGMGAHRRHKRTAERRRAGRVGAGRGG